MMTPLQSPSPAPRTWPFFSTPPAVFAGVMGPLTIMMAILASLSGMPIWIRLSAAIVVVVSLRALWRGYLCRIQATPTHVRYKMPLRQWSIPWSDVRRIDAYVPLDRNLTTRYVYITRRDEPPSDRREIDGDTLQLQDRPGLVDALRAYHRSALPHPSPSDGRAAGSTPAAASPDMFISSAPVSDGGSHS